MELKLNSFTSKQMECEQFFDEGWAGKNDTALFSRVHLHSDKKYSAENPYVSELSCDIQNKPDGGDTLKIKFEALSCEYDNFKTIRADIGENADISFHENGEIYFCGAGTGVMYAIDKWYSFTILADIKSSKAVLLIDGKLVMTNKFGNITGLEKLSVITTAYPTYGPILASTAGICSISYTLTDADVNMFIINKEPFQLNAAYDEVFDKITPEFLSIRDNGSRFIRHSLNFYHHADVSYISGDLKHITESGRVIRPKAGEPDTDVTVTVIQLDKKKEFQFTVLADEPFYDPCHMSDEELFGVYKNNEWDVKGKFNYSMLPSVEKAVKNYDYSAAKRELFHYYKNKELVPLQFQEGQTGYANMIIDDMHQLQQGYYIGEMNVTNEWSENIADVNINLIKPNATITFSLRAWYNENSAAQIDDIPQLELIINGDKRSFIAQDVAMIKAGEYKSVNFKDEKYCSAEMFGDFLGNNTSYILVKFAITGISSNDMIEKAILKAKTRIIPYYAKTKRLIIVKEFSSVWEKATVKFDDFIYSVFNYEGLPDVNKWIKAPMADMEYLWQTARLPFYSAVIKAYIETGDDNYIYKLQRNIEEAILTFGGFTSSNNRYTYDKYGIRGGYTRTLDASGKFESLCRTLAYLAKSPYATEDCIIAFLKAIWDNMRYLLKNCDRYAGNWTEFIYKGLLYSAPLLKEFTQEIDGESWLDACYEVFEDMIANNVFQDGSYKEGNSGYCQTALDNYVKVKRKFKEMGIEVSDKYNDVLHKNAVYCANLFTANGSSLTYGDCINYSRDYYNDWDEILEMLQDDELRYIITFGKEGIKPKQTLYHYPDSRLSVMRSDFSKDALYLFTDVRSGGGHSHADENSVILAGYGRTLLCDSGVFSYSPDDPYRIWGHSTRAHNTVMVNDSCQITADMVSKVPEGRVYSVETNEKYDHVVQSSFAYDGIEHKRSILFIKPYMFVVRDELIVSDDKKENNYKQLWHFLPQANTSITGKIIETHFETGANIKIICLNDNANAVLAEGWVDASYGQVENASYTYYEQNKTGNAEFVTLLIPTRENIEVKAELNGDIVKIEYKSNEVCEVFEYEL